MNFKKTTTGNYVLLNNSVEQFDLDVLTTLIAELLPTGQPNLEKAAQFLTISPRTLQRRLAENDLTFSQVIDEVRFVTARQLILKNTKLSEIAIQLGYADAGSFTRAFERWTGMSPQKYRNQFAGGSTAKQRRSND